MFFKYTYNIIKYLAICRLPTALKRTDRISFVYRVTDKQKIMKFYKI